MLLDLSGDHYYVHALSFPSPYHYLISIDLVHGHPFKTRFSIHSKLFQYDCCPGRDSTLTVRQLNHKVFNLEEQSFMDSISPLSVPKAFRTMINRIGAFDKSTYSLETNPLENSHEPTSSVPPQDEGWKAWIFLAAGGYHSILKLGLAQDIISGSKMMLMAQRILDGVRRVSPVLLYSPTLCRDWFSLRDRCLECCKSLCRILSKVFRLR